MEQTKNLETFIEEILQIASENKMSYSDIKYIATNIKMKASHRSAIIQKQLPNTFLKE